MRVHHIGITVKDLEISCNFYKENFGFEEVDRFTKPGWTGEAIILKNASMRLEIFAFSDFKEKNDDYSNLKQIGIKHIGMQVDDVNKKY